MNKILSVFLILIGTLIISYSQSEERLEEYGINKYYSLEETTDNTFSSIEIKPTPIYNEKINNKFSNIDDLNWLSDISKNNNVLLVGETHYSRFIGNIASRIFFAINTYDYYATIFIERQYSTTEFINYFLSIKDDKTANDYFNNELIKYINTEEEAIFFKQIRNWNTKHKKKPLSIGATDLEFNAYRTLNSIIKPYLYKLKDIDKNEVDSIINLGLSDDFFTGIKPLIEQAERRELIGKYPFLTHSYVKNIIKNLESTKIAYAGNFNINRHSAIKRNLTDKDFFGSKFQNSKAMLYGGGSHMNTRSNNNSDNNALSEGVFLTNEFLPTKGKTYSIMVDGMGSFNLDEMSNRALNECLKQGTQYKKMVTRLKKADNDGLLNPKKPYFIFFQRNDFEKLIVSLSYKYNDNSILISDKNWSKIKLVIDKLSKEERKLYEELITQKKKFDSYIFVPHSPIVTARYK